MRRLLAFALCLVVSGCGNAPAPGTSAPGPTLVQHAESLQGPFRLVFELPRGSWQSGDAIDGLAALSVVNGPGVDLGGSGGGVLGFAFAEVGGTRHVDPVSSADCAPYRLEPGDPITSTVKKSGAFSADQPDAAFYSSFFADPLVHLPAGDWNISAVAEFVEGTGCTGLSHTMTATILVHITQ